MRLIIILCATAAMAGCVPFLGREAPPATAAVPGGPTFCYRTLAGVDCYDHAVPGNDRALVGVSVPPPTHP